MTKNYYTWEEVKARMSVRRTWWDRAFRAVRRTVCWSNVRYQIRRPKWAWQRMRRGWSDLDAWSFDTYLAGVIAGGLTNIRDGHSYPIDMTEDEWRDYLNSIIAPLKAYNKWEPATAEESCRAAEAAMHRLADRFGNMWD